MSIPRAEGEDGPVSPPWGALPAEQYLIRNWDWGSTDPSSVQRLKLIRRFLVLPEIDNLDVLGSNRDRWFRWDLVPDLNSIVMPRPPTSREIENVLKPWRPLRLRRIAVAYWMEIWLASDEATWLRTYYGPGSDEIWQQFMEKEEEENPRFDEKLRIRLLSDVACFNFGDNWDLLFDLLPEICGYPPRDSLIESLEHDREEIKQIMRANELKDKESRIFSIVQWMQFYCYRDYLVVADEEAFATGKLRLVFYDRTRNIVRHGRIPVEEAHMVTAYQGQGQIIEQYWTDYRDTYCELGDKYLRDGEFGQLLYDLGDPAMSQELRDIIGDWEPGSC